MRTFRVSVATASRALGSVLRTRSPPAMARKQAPRKALVVWWDVSAVGIPFDDK